MLDALGTVSFESLRDALAAAAARFAENRRVLTPMGMAGIDRC